MSDSIQISQMRQAFERTNSRDHRRQPPKGNNYIDPMAQADWDSFQKGWQASREAVVVELPKDIVTMAGPVLYADDVRAAIEAQGLKVEVKP